MKKFNTIALIDDDKISNHITYMLLKKLDLAESILIFSNGLEAIDFLKGRALKTKECPELILLDINMPSMDGFEFIEKYKKLNFENKDQVQIVVLTTSSHPKDFDKMKELGVTFFLNKPLTPDKLSEVLIAAKLLKGKD